jgi:hypothetical protein
MCGNRCGGLIWRLQMNKLVLVAVCFSLLCSVAGVAEEKEEEQPLTWKLYGYLKFDAAYDTARTDVGNFARWVLPQPGGDDDDEFNMTARQSRFGISFSGPSTSEYTVSGKVELDFYGSGSENKPEPFMRHAYMQIHWKAGDFILLAGQFWDVFSPLNAPTVNYSPAWWSGNIGYRRPQLRLTKLFNSESGMQIQLTGAVARTIGHQSGYFPGDSGEDNAFPTVQGRIGLSTPLGDGGQFAVGVSGHFGQEEYDLAADGNNVEFDSWSANLDVMIKFAGGITLKGEYFTGKNLDSYLGGIGQGLNLANLSEIETTGGWASLTIPASDGLVFNLAAAMEDPDDDTLAAGQRSHNTSVWGNVNIGIVKNVTLGLELARWTTEYKDGEEWESLRGQMALTYSF